MRKLVRNAATVLIAAGVAVSVAPAASAAGHGKGNTAPEDVINVYVGRGDAQFANEFGPGNLASNWVQNSKKVGVAAQNEAIRTGDIKNAAKGKGASAPFEIEGSEQDQNEG
ncbi:hypothetical protein ABZ569_05360 [Streptomyces albus]|uniref:hypothetical protein n=1 Tax=Streptomyces albus TaxID=1888 RepID=UPI00340677A5